MKNSIYDDVPDEYSTLRKGWMFFEKVRIVSELLNHKKKTVFLDFGCGTGDFLADLAAAFPDSVFIGYDLNEKYVSHAGEKFSRLGNLSFTSSLDALFREDFDLAYVNDVIHHFPTEADFFDAIGNLKWKKFLVIEPNQFNPYVAYMQYVMPGERNFRQSRFESEVRERGIGMIEKRFRFMFPNSFKSLSPSFVKINSALENSRFLGGAVQYLIEPKA